MSDSPTRQEALDKIAELITDCRVGLLTTIDADGLPWSRPMGRQGDGFDGTVAFLTAADTEKVDAIEARSAAGVVFARPEDQAYVTLAGRAEVSNDREAIRAAWNEDARAWYPEGPDDPSLRLIRFEAERGEYWDSPSSMIVYAIGYAKAVLSGEPLMLGENAKVEL